MGIFSLFGKKGGRKEDHSTEKSSARKTRSKSANTVITGFQDSEIFTNSIIAQRHIARATERKIDAIEFEMSRDIVKTRPPAVSKLGIPKAVGKLSENSRYDITETTQPFGVRPSAVEFQTTLPMTMPTDYLLGHHSEMSGAAVSYSESVPVLEEAAILFASGQNDVAEQMLNAAVHHQNLSSATEIGWQMLFDLYRITNNQHKFESLSLDYANKFETSPPLWPENNGFVNTDTLSEANGVTPSIMFPPKLDSGIVKVLEKMQQTSAKSQSLRLDFSRIKEVDPIGCGLLLRSLKNLKKTGHDLMLVSAQDLAEKIRSILQVGRRDETEAPWLLLLEILQLLHFERAFEEASMDYCITFEVSPPSFEAPKVNVTSSFPEIKASAEEEYADRFMMPASIEGRVEPLINQISDKAEHLNPLVLDCSKLERVEFSASAELLNGLAPIAAKRGMSIEFREVNYLVMMLFNAMGLKNIASITLRKH
ncbi:STAS domain-containing protein [Undibacterium sp. Dicai25W]|uniref:STAS domain-containing protein n=1 Tax=Undibacterium sp. Dicai25W TaxID=3413034 RepID=UPI003BF2E920